jgi:uncharacterized protein
MSPGEAAVLLAAAAAAGAMNAMAGGGTILTYPALVLLGHPPVAANATSTVALLPGAAASLFGFRREVEAHREWLKTLLLPSLLGGAIGSVLLLRTPDRLFARLAPLLVLFATILFLVQGVLSRRRGVAEASGAGFEPQSPADGRRRWLAAWLFQLAVAIYGGYFGAGIGILMLAVLGFLGLSDIHAMNGLKNFFNLCINSVAAGYFIWRGAVDWPAALVLMGGAIAGGYGGARFSRLIGRERARTAVIAIGLLVTAVLFWQQARG